MWAELPSSDRWCTTGREGGRAVCVYIYIRARWGGGLKIYNSHLFSVFLLFLNTFCGILLHIVTTKQDFTCIHKLTLYIVMSRISSIF